MVAHLLYLNCNRNFTFQVVRLLGSHRIWYTLSLRASNSKLYIIFRSTAYMYGLSNFMMLHISFIYMRNKDGTNTLPWITPLVIDLVNESHLTLPFVYVLSGMKQTMNIIGCWFRKTFIRRGIFCLGPHQNPSWNLKAKLIQEACCLVIELSHSDRLLDMCLITWTSENRLGRSYWDY